MTKNDTSQKKKLHLHWNDERFNVILMVRPSAETRASKNFSVSMSCENGIPVVSPPQPSAKP
jgi:hypothetical protein